MQHIKKSISSTLDVSTYLINENETGTRVSTTNPCLASKPPPGAGPANLDWLNCSIGGRNSFRGASAEFKLFLTSYITKQNDTTGMPTRPGDTILIQERGWVRVTAAHFISYFFPFHLSLIPQSVHFLPSIFFQYGTAWTDCGIASRHKRRSPLSIDWVDSLLLLRLPVSWVFSLIFTKQLD